MTVTGLVALARAVRNLFLESTFIDQNNPTRHKAGPLNGAHPSWTLVHVA